MIDQDDFDGRLRESLARQAGGAPQADLTKGALRRARRIRASRRIGAGVAAAAVAAVVVPLGVRIVGDGGPTATTTSQPTHASPSPNATEDVSPSPTRTNRPPATVDVSLAGLSRGPDPRVPYVEDRTYFHNGSSTALTDDGGGSVVDASEFVEGPAAWTFDSTTGTAHLSARHVDGALRLGSASSEPAVDASNGFTAWAEYGLDLEGGRANAKVVKGKPTDAVLLYTDSIAGDASMVDAGGLRVTKIVGAANGVVVFNATRGAREVVARVDMRSASPQIEEIAGLSGATALSPDLRLMSVWGQDTDPNGYRCSAMIAVESSPADRSGSCAWKPMRFSPDGARVYAEATDTEGFGPRVIAVLDAETGAVLQRFTTPGTFGRAAFEDADHVDIVVVDQGSSAIVRCTIGGDCELATNPRPAEPDSLIAPFQLTAGW